MSKENGNRKRINNEKKELIESACYKGGLQSRGAVEGREEWNGMGKMG